MGTHSFKTELCKCNKCDTIMVDENPQVGQTLHVITDGLTDDGKMVEELEYCDDMDSFFWGCPCCLTDDFLTDY